MSDIQYSVELVYLTKGSLGGANALGHFSQMHGEIGKIDHALGRVGDSFATGFGRAVDFVSGALLDTVGGAALAAGGMLTTALTHGLKEGLSFESYKESAKIGLATIQSMLADTPIDVGMANAEKSVENLRRLSMSIPARLSDVIGVFQSVLPAGLNAALPMSRLESFAAKATVAAAALGVNQKMAGHEFAALLEGRARSSMPVATRLGIHSSEFNKLSPMARFTKLEGLLNKTDLALDLYRQSAIVLLTTAKDYGQQFASVFAAPLFGSLKAEGQKGIAYLATHEDEINAMLTSLGVGVDAAFHRGLDLAKKWVPIGIQFGETLYAGIVRAIHVLEPYVSRFGGALERFAKDPNALAKIGDVGAGLLGAKGASEAMGLGGDALASIGRFGPMISAAGIGLGDMAIASGVGAAALAVLAAGGYGAVDILTDASNTWHDGAIESINHIKANTTKIGEAAEKAAPALRSVADAIGAYWIKGLEFWSTAFGVAADAATEKLGNFSGALDLASAAIFGLAHKNEPADRPDFVNGANALVPWFSAMADEADKRGHGVPKPPNHVTHIHGGVQIKVDTSNQDPSRVARAVADVLLDLHRHPRVSSLNPNNRFVR